MTALFWITSTMVLIAIVACAFALCDSTKKREENWYKNHHHKLSPKMKILLDSEIPERGRKPRTYTESEMFSFGYYCRLFLEENRTHGTDPLTVCFERWKSSSKI